MVFGFFFIVSSNIEFNVEVDETIAYNAVATLKVDKNGGNLLFSEIIIRQTS